jgi:hypothetical protein
LLFSRETSLATESRQQQKQETLQTAKKKNPTFQAFKIFNFFTISTQSNHIINQKGTHTTYISKIIIIISITLKNDSLRPLLNPTKKYKKGF